MGKTYQEFGVTQARRGRIQAFTLIERVPR